MGGIGDNIVRANDEGKTRTFVQTKFNDNQILSINSNTFRHPFSDSPNNNCFIITFQNYGRQPKYYTHWKSVQASKLFTISGANVELYAEISLNEAKLDPNKKFNDIK